jgi:Ca2+-binding EF-hand superfamily protein
MILKAADENNDGLISVEEVEHLLERIGAADQLSKDEIETIMKDIGIDQGVGVPVKKVKDFFLPPKPPKGK